MKSFNSIEDAFKWMEIEVDDPCIDNRRWCWVGDSLGEDLYHDTWCIGCCGYFDRKVLIGGRLAKIGCNYGH